ncbi:unnamed protein product [Oppiella nova]|uniref:Regulatory factor X-associated protein RFXANK-binding domain-containing protein n=1 Tax=Oppiella nova TaxID=334625 RepID=A0A7R9LK88_9ACAR|nr:unnamed protein product [Oppiella nova]CAG2164464.1 unnamed protein product [Oppiella nova]
MAECSDCSDCCCDHNCHHLNQMNTKSPPKHSNNNQNKSSANSSQISDQSIKNGLLLEEIVNEKKLNLMTSPVVLQFIRDNHKKMSANKGTN